MPRTADVQRKTLETDIRLRLTLEQQGPSSIRTGNGFFDHMLSLLARHGMMALSVDCQGDLDVDCHHTVEDVGICFGQALAKALGDKRSIARYGTFYVPMDEALCRASLDLSGRGFLVYDAPAMAPRVGDFDTETAEDFFRAVADAAGMTLHIQILYGRNSHHMLEAAFKAFGRALDCAVRLDPRVEGVPSTKGSL
jgi:imidazoleglycerol-phosphate dehydratase